MFDRIRWRLTFAYVGVLAVILLLFGVVVLVGFWNENARQQDRALTKEAEVFAQAVASGQTMAEIPMTSETEEYGSVELASDGRVLFRDPTAPEMGLPSLAAAREAARQGRTIVTTTEGPMGESRVASAPVIRAEGVSGVVQLGRSRRAERDAVNVLGLVLVPIGLGALALAGVGGLFLAGRALRPAREAFARQRAFIADASHELKTPLTLIRADAEVHLRGLTDPRERELIEDLLGETDQMNAVLSDLLILARLDAGKLAVAREPFDLSAAAREAVERFQVRAAAEEKRLELLVRGERGALGDADRAGQVLAALLDNALRFTAPGDRVAVDVGREQGRVVATVADSGPGLGPEPIGRVFDRFYRAEAGRSREHGGTGLGLAIARDLARAQGGDLRAANGQEGGAVFRLELPAATPPSRASARVPGSLLPARLHHRRP